MTLNGFTYISNGCCLLTEVVINDMPTLSDKCVLVGLRSPAVRSERCLPAGTFHALSSQALIGGCRFLASISLLGSPHLSNAVLKVIAETTSLHSFGLEGELSQHAALVPERTD